MKKKNLKGIFAMLSIESIWGDTIRQRLFLILIICLLPIKSSFIHLKASEVTVLPKGYWTDSGNYSRSLKGDGTAATNPFIIESAADLAYLAKFASAENTSGKFYKITKDIDLSAHYWIPIAGFSGTLDGAAYDTDGVTVKSNYMIDNVVMNIDDLGTEGNKGLFASITSLVGKRAEVKHITICHAEIYGRSQAGVLAGSADGIIENVHVKGVLVKFKSANVGDWGSIGGLIGTASDGAEIRGCTLTGIQLLAESEGATCIGGLVGKVDDGVQIVRCTSEVIIGGTLSGAKHLGGLIGGIGTTTSQNRLSPFHIVDCNVKVQIGDEHAIPYGHAGGFIGSITGTYPREAGRFNILRCVAKGQIYGGVDAGNYAGRLVGGFIGGVSGTGQGNLVISQCGAEVEVNTCGQWTGGFIGCIIGDALQEPESEKGLSQRIPITIRQCYAKGTVFVNRPEKPIELDVAGFVGQLSARGVTFDNCFATGGVVVLDNRSDGGLAGFIGKIGRNGDAESTVIKHCYATGRLLGADKKRYADESHSGGFIGIMRNSGTRLHEDSFGNFYNTTATAYENKVGRYWGAVANTETAKINGISEEEMRKMATFAASGWDFENIWTIDEQVNNGYPVLRDAQTGSSSAGLKKGHVYFISPEGNDSNPATIDRPWRTFLHATMQLRAGDTLYVRGGVYTGVDAITTVRAYDSIMDYREDFPATGAPYLVSRHPHNSGLFFGTEDAPITIKAFQNEKPVLTITTPIEGEDFVCGLYGVSWWTIDGLAFIDCTYPNSLSGKGGQSVFHIYKSDHVVIRNCIFDNRDDVPFRKEPERRSLGFIVALLSANLTTQGCYFNGCGANILFNGDPDAANFIGCHYVLIEDNYFGKAGHSGPASGGTYLTDEQRWFYRDFEPLFGCGILPEQYPVEKGNHDGFHENFKQSMYIICQNNIVDNHFGGGIYIGGQHVVVQNNLIYHAGHQVDYVKPALNVTGASSIYRNNIMVAANYEDKGPDEFQPAPRQSVYQEAISFTGFTGAGLSHNAIGHKLYNNIAYHSGWSGLYMAETQGTKLRNNIFKNNIFLENNVRHQGIGTPGHANTPPAELLFYGFAVQDGYFNQFPYGNNFFNNILKSAKETDAGLVSHVAATIGGNFDKSLKQVEADYPWGFANNLEQDPLFEAPAQRPDVLMTESFDKDSYRLTAGSPAINAGANLTTVTKSGVNVKKVFVEDAGYFCDGYGLIPGDPVKIGNNAIVRVEKVNLTDNTIMVSKPVNVKTGDAVNLPYNGKAPDIGAYQYTANPEILVDRLEVENNLLTVLGLITADWGNQVIVNVTDSKGKVVYIEQVNSGNAGSFRFEIPLPGRDVFTLTIGGTAVQTPTIIFFSNEKSK